ncbi:phosphoglycerate dehydrogenase [Lactiplantibacillus songbeiensis]|uniref:Phosphoglycerate dehydrogenase n=1 Tax=Lactiplantibacillus songbeiensis TaxID=2559920 RepID=A0ABW4C115_9LACO|nr:phosphoglycerate dehydrogenase [Lactiplantibacillus songbeiensis]
MPLALMVQSTKPAQLQTLQQLYPDWQFMPVADLQPQDYAQVTVMYGYHPVLNAILALADNRLRFLQVISAGVDYLPLTDLQAQGVLVANTSGIHADAISESVLGAMLTVTRGYQAAWQNQNGARQWALPITTSTLTGRQLLVFGTGQIGQAIATKAAAFGLHLIGVNTSGHPAPGFDETVALTASGSAVATADFIVNALPLTPATHHFFNATLFAQARQRPLLINIGRGPAVDTMALITALDQHQLSGAVLDVTEPEPLPADHPLWQRPDVIITPHISGQISHFRATVFPIFAANFAAWIKTGQLANHQVDLTRGY